MSPQVYAKRKSAIKLADTLNKIEGVPVSEYARLFLKTCLALPKKKN